MTLESVSLESDIETYHIIPVDQETSVQREADVTEGTEVPDSYTDKDSESTLSDDDFVGWTEFQTPTVEQNDPSLQYA